MVYIPGPLKADAWPCRMFRSRLQFLLLLAGACFFVFAYPVWRLTAWAGEPLAVGWPAILGIWIVGLLGVWISFQGPRLVIRYVVVHWMGASFVFATVVAVYELLRLVWPLPDRSAVPWLLATGGLLTLLAIVTSHHVVVRRFEITSDKLIRPLRVVQISDIHIGSRQGGFLRRIADRINQLKPDYVAITGDLIDTSAVDIDALRPLETLVGTTFFSVGNHERYADLPKAIAMLESLGVIPLRQETYLAENVQFIGIDDDEHPSQVARNLPEVGVRQDHFSILLYHRPVGWESAIDHGVDLMLSGHTHNGQIFPFNLLVKQRFRRIRGLFRQQGCHLYVSSGTGTWGPLMRLGSMNEISCFDLRPLPGTEPSSPDQPASIRAAGFR